ncbi:MAG TPA: alpha/beta hydrolase [Streptosporangiaceae bacterium]|nr:alpha/beta hydrolase [Streptosporangiaceae bacterium]
MTGTVTSADGTPIGYTRAGSGPVVILVDGALNDRALNGPNPRLAAVLAAGLTVYTYDRRGRGHSGDTLPYAVEREIEDLEALITAAGGTAAVYGISSGGALALEASNRLRSISRLAVYEVPFVTDGSRPPIPDEFAGNLASLAEDGRRAEAVRYFFTAGIGLPRIFVAVMRLMPAWSKLTGLAHTLPYDARLIGQGGAGRPLPPGRWAGVTIPVLVLAGGKSPAWMRTAMHSLAAVLPTAEHRVLEGQTHLVKPAALAPVLAEFFST